MPDLMPKGESGQVISGEFDRIANFWRPLATDDAALNLQDDAAILPAAPQGMQFVIAKDCLVAGTHFFADDPLDLVARKLIRVNLSDMAAMGATPWGYLMGLALPGGFSDQDMQALQEGLADEQSTHGMTLLGGDTTSTAGPLMLSCTMLGLIPTGKALRRDGARAGDLIVVTGPIGDAGLGLQWRLGNLPDLAAEDALAIEAAYLLPEPQTGIAPRLLDLATACADISDGLLQDVGHISRASGLHAVLFQDDIPISPVAGMLLAKGSITKASLLGAGDDYKLVFTLPAAKRDALLFLEKALDRHLYVVGEMRAPDALQGTDVSLLDGKGVNITPEKTGWQHSRGK